MLIAYFDESGTHGEQARVTTVAGLLGDSIEWARLELPWKKRLAPLTCFHASHCESQLNDFKDFTKSQSQQMIVDLSLLISCRKLIPVGGAVYRDDFNYAASDKIKKYFPSRFHASLAMAILRTSIFAQVHAPGEKVAFVFAEQQEYREYTKTLHDVLYHGLQWGNIGSLTIAKPANSIELQAADLYTYEISRELLTQLDEPGLSGPKREAMKIIFNSMHIESYVATIEMLHRLVDEYDKKD